MESGEIALEREKIKRVFTLGPASSDCEILEKMVESCVNNGHPLSFRLNLGHVNEQELEQWMNQLLCMRAHQEWHFGIVLDLQSAKPRIGEYAETKLFNEEEACLVLGNKSFQRDCIPVPIEGLFTGCQEGEIFSINDGKVVLQAMEVYSEKILCRLLRAGEIAPNKGINSNKRQFTPERISQEDLNIIEFTRGIEGVEYAVSFAMNGEEKSLFTPYINYSNRFIAKIEHPSCLENLAQISENYDELWFCRGDYGSFVPLHKLGKHQKLFVQLMQNLNSKGQGKPYLIAGGVLNGMLTSDLPSRAELVQLYDCLESGFSGFVLSEETALGTRVGLLLELLSTFP